jgi:hypothetical protein
MQHVNGRAGLPGHLTHSTVNLSAIQIDTWPHRTSAGKFSPIAPNLLQAGLPQLDINKFRGVQNTTHAPATTFKNPGPAPGYPFQGEERRLRRSALLSLLLHVEI